MPQVKVDLFDCDVRLGGGLLHVVPKKGINDRELRLLKFMHGQEQIVNAKKTGSATVDEFEMHMELALMYGKERVEKVFNVNLDLFDIWKADRYDEAESRRQAERMAAEAEEQKRLQAQQSKTKVAA